AAPSVPGAVAGLAGVGAAVGNGEVELEGEWKELAFSPELLVTFRRMGLPSFADVPVWVIEKLGPSHARRGCCSAVCARSRDLESRDAAARSARPSRPATLTHVVRHTAAQAIDEDWSYLGVDARQAAAVNEKEGGAGDNSPLMSHNDP